MFKFHPTPAAIVNGIIRKHIPKSARKVLEPAFGDGALLGGVDLDKCDVTCVDIDIDKVKNGQKVFWNKEIKFVHSDFVQVKFQRESFDLVVCNPPFDGRKLTEYNEEKLPVEAVFLQKSIDVCKPKGRLIFVLPSSVVQGTRLSLFRRKLLSQLSLTYCYKLERFCFKGIEGSFSVLVFDKSKRQNRKTNFISSSGERYSCKVGDHLDSYSFDADENLAAKEFMDFVSLQALGFKKFNEIACIYRGKVTGDYSSNAFFHTSDAKESFTGKLTKFDENMITEKDIIFPGEIYIKRVSRGISDSLSVYDQSPKKFTDCILKITPTANLNIPQVMFALMVTLQREEVKQLIEKGSGAKYLDSKTLNTLAVPTKLHILFPTLYMKFCSEDHHGRIVIAKRVNMLLNSEREKYTSKCTSGDFKIIEDHEVMTTILAR